MRQLVLVDKICKTHVSTNKNNAIPTHKITHLLPIKQHGAVSLELCPNLPLNSALLAEISPIFCAVTWLSDNVHNLDEIDALSMCQNLQATKLLHLAGQNLTTFQAEQILTRAKSYGVQNILALQGDSARQTPEKGDFPHASDLVRFINSTFPHDFSVAVAGYPETHPNSKNQEADLHYLKEKVLAGADLILTQATFETEALLSFLDKCRRLRITAPIIPGLFVISSKKTVIRMSKICKVRVSDGIMRIIGENSDEAVRNFGIHLASEMIKRILGQTELKLVHFFSLNDLELVQQVRNRVWPKVGFERVFLKGANVNDIDLDCRDVCSLCARLRCRAHPSPQCRPMK